MRLIQTRRKTSNRPKQAETPFFMFPPLPKGPSGGWSRPYCHSCTKPFDPVGPHSRKSSGHGTCVSCLDRLRELASVEAPIFPDPNYGPEYTSIAMGFREE